MESDGPADAYSIDQLLQTREQDLFFSQQLDNATTTEDEVEEVNDQNENQSLVGNIPLSVFALIEDGPHTILCSKMLKQWQWKACQFYPEAIMPSAAFFGLIQQLILTPNEQVGRAVIECAAHLCESSIVYASWYSFMKEGMHTAVDSAVFLLAISDFEKFSFENDEQAKNARVSIIVLHVAAMLCPLVSEHPAYGRALKSLRNNLKQEHLFDNEDIMKIVDIVAGISMDVPVRNLNLFLSLFPFDGVGKRLVYSIGIKLCFLLMGMESVPEDPTTSDLTSIIGYVKNMCDRSIACDLNKASIIIALTERIVVSGMILMLVTRDHLDEICRKLRFPIVNSGSGGSQVFLKEQLHVTRCQLESLLATFPTD